MLNNFNSNSNSFFKFKKALKSLDGVIVQISTLVGGAFVGIITTDVIEAAIGSFIFFIAAMLFIRLIKPRYNIKKNKFQGIFVDKLVSDVNNFSDSNTSAIEANRRMCDDSKVIYNFSKTYPIFKDELETLNLVRNWLKEGADRKISFNDIINEKGLDCMAKELAEKVKKSIKVDELKINTSIVEPGCVGLIEKMREYGIPIKHDFCDINGIEQARSLAGGENYSAALMPFSTIYLSRERKQIIEKYKYLCSITWEEQMIIGKRDANGEFLIKKAACPERGSGHYQLITMMSNGELGINADNPIDLGGFKNKNDDTDSVVLYQPVAAIYKEVKEHPEHWGYINRAFPVDIILVVNEGDFGGDTPSFQSLVIVLMAMMKSDLSKAKTFGNKLYKKKEYRNAFEGATGHFVNILNK